ncbi:cyclopropane-fatty-acyl-phospholipid synthase family protein [Vibrio sp.]|nr:cyclopropane-fatty-acyl-phospholipid synthase family protein [Vibrio sp.]
MTTMNSVTMNVPVQMTRSQTLSRTCVLGMMNRVKVGCISIVESFNGTSSKIHIEGSGELSATVIVHDPCFYEKVLKGGDVAIGESYMDGDWESNDLTTLIRIMVLNLNLLDQINAKSSIVVKLIDKAMHFLNRNSLSTSKKNIEAHYDLGNDLYDAFLDTNMLYSSALYLSDTDSLEQAQINKMYRLCQQMQLQPSDHVIEIGTGWGGMAVYMAKQYGCRVTTTTISEEQHAYVEALIQREGLNEKITLLKKDYRLLEGQFDKLVSIEMIEAVGKEYLNSYIDKCSHLLKPQGIAAIQAITINDQRYDYYANNVDFIQKYIFPGGFLPSITSVANAATNHSDLVIRDIHDIGQSYAKTLKEWRNRFNRAYPSLESKGYNERFARMWRYYLCYCEGGFLAKSISTVHMTFEKGMK